MREWVLNSKRSHTFAATWQQGLRSGYEHYMHMHSLSKHNKQLAAQLTFFVPVHLGCSLTSPLPPFPYLSACVAANTSRPLLPTCILIMLLQHA